MRSLPLGVLAVVGGVASALGAWHLSFAAVFLGLALLCLALARLGRLAAVGLLAASTSATLFVLEVGLALLRPAAPPALQLTGERFRQHATATDLGELPAPGRYAMRQVSAAGETIFDVTYTIDSDGFRVTPGARDDGTDRVALFGCSYAFGHGLEDDETLAFQLGRLLEVDVRNFAVNGGGPHHALAILESERDTTAAVHVLLTASWHAQRIACLRPWSGGSPRYRLVAGELVRDGVCPEGGATPMLRVLRHSRVFDVLERGYRALRRSSITAAELDLYVAVIERLAARSRERGRALVIGYIGADVFNGLPLDNEALMRRLAAVGAEVVDVSLGPSAAALAPEYVIHALDQHPSARANAARAARLAPLLATILEARTKGPTAEP